MKRRKSGYDAPVTEHDVSYEDNSSITYTMRMVAIISNVVAQIELPSE
jgi:hypothetical protein